MIKRLKILAFTITSGTVLIFTLCLGSQNLNSRHSINLLTTKTAPLPSGFIIGVTMVIGVLTGGSLTALLIPANKVNQQNKPN